MRTPGQCLSVAAIESSGVSSGACRGTGTGDGASAHSVVVVVRADETILESAPM